jgi:hypothetical protein
VNVTGSRRAGPRSLVALLALVLAAPAAGYLPPASAILKRVVQRREELRLTALEARGSVTLTGEPARRLAGELRLPPPAGELTLPALIAVKAPGRCRLELAPDGVALAERPAVSLRNGRMLGHRGLEAIAPARALVEGLCTLLGERTSGNPDPERAFAQGLAARGVALPEVALGRLAGRVAWVLGGRPQEARPQAWIDKQTFQPVRLVAPLAGARRDLRLLDFGAPVGGDAFPRAAEVWSGNELELRFIIEKLTQNPRLPDAVF